MLIRSHPTPPDPITHQFKTWLHNGSKAQNPRRQDQVVGVRSSTAGLKRKETITFQAARERRKERRLRATCANLYLAEREKETREEEEARPLNWSHQSGSKEDEREIDQCRACRQHRLSFSPHAISPPPLGQEARPALSSLQSGSPKSTISKVWNASHSFNGWMPLVRPSEISLFSKCFYHSGTQFSLQLETILFNWRKKPWKDGWFDML